MTKNYSKFYIFLENLKNKENSYLIDTIQSGFKLIESLSTDDANVRPMGQAVPITGTPANVTYITPNSDNEYFNKTVDDKVLKIVNKAQAGKRTWQHAKAGRWVNSEDPFSFGDSSHLSAHGAEQGWAGTSGGYNLGGPL